MSVTAHRGPVLRPPDIPMYVELRSSDRTVTAQAQGPNGSSWNPRGQMMNNQTIELEPREYELRVSRDKGFSCYKNVWFIVRQASSRIK